MTRPDFELEELLRRDLDGELSAAEAAALEARIAQDPEAGKDAQRLRSAAAALAAAGQVEVPTGMAARVMRQVRAMRRPRPAWRRALDQLLGPAGVIGTEPTTQDGGRLRTLVREGGVMSKRTVVLAAIGLAAVAAIGYFAIHGYPPVGGGTEATVGAAKRYQAEQVKPSDVILEDAERQAFLQSETFDHIVRDPDLRKAVTNAAFQRLVADPATYKLMADPATYKLVADPAFGRLVADPAFDKLMADPAFDKLIADPAFDKLMADPATYKLMADPAIAAALAEGRGKR